jgi:hypothetical protein
MKVELGNHFKYVIFLIPPENFSNESLDKIQKKYLFHKKRNPKNQLKIKSASGTPF